jgi:branched-chain amino acid transport system ATP-binding protein
MSGLSFSWLRKMEGAAQSKPRLEIRSLAVRVGIRTVLDDLSISIYPGEHLRIIGPNGSGKSSLLNAIAGIEPSRIISGSILLNGTDITDLPPHERSTLGIAYLRQSDNVFSTLTVAENLFLSLGHIGPKKFLSVFPEWSREIPLTKTAGYLSGGQKKKLAWAMTILQEDAKIFLLDEPRSGMESHLELGFPFGDSISILEIEHI